MMSSTPTRLLAFLAPLVISLPLLAEVIRKYVYPSNLVLPLAEILAVFVALALFQRLPVNRATAVLGALIVASIAWGLLTIAFGHQDFALGMVGLRNFLVPCAFLVIGASLGNTFTSDRFTGLLHRVFTLWFVALALVAVFQLLVGRDHWLNAIPEGMGDERGGIGDYTVGEVGLDFLFRPTSIFLHTGKLGAVLFVLSSYRLCYAASSYRRNTFWIGRVFDVVVLMVSGQRAAIVGYGLVAVVVGLMRSGRRSLAVVVMAVALGAIGLAIFGWVTASGGSESIGIGALIFMRTVSGVVDIPLRVADNVIAPLEYVLAHYALSPAGLGAFSFGSAQFGGQPLYEVVPIGTAENAWLRLLAEQGLLGLVLAGAFWIALVFYSVMAWRNARMVSVSWVHGKSDLTTLALCPALILAVLLLWANTHDVLGNVTVMSLFMVTFGAAMNWLQRRDLRGGKKTKSLTEILKVSGRAVR